MELYCSTFSLSEPFALQLPIHRVSLSNSAKAESRGWSSRCRSMPSAGISDAIFYKWRSKFGGMNISDVKRLRQLEEENARLKRLVGEQALDIVVLKDVISKNF